MGFSKGKRRGSLWADIITLNKIIHNHNFNTSSKSEKDFENAFASVLMDRRSEFKNQIYSQIHNETKVKSVYCFAKNHRPDICIGEDGIALEIKYISDSADAFKHAIGQAIIYRLRYRFCVIVLIVSKNFHEFYQKTVNGEEKSLEDLLRYLSKDLNIFSYVIPSFSIKTKGINNIFHSNNI